MAVPTSSCTAVTLQGAVLVDDFVVTDADPGRVPPKGSLFLTR
jgi:hypothetical protein